MKTKSVPLLVVSSIVVSSFFVFANVYVITQLEREHHLGLLSNHPFLLIPQAFGITEEQIHGISSFEMVPTELIPGKPTLFEIKFQYTTGPYALDNLIPVIGINPASANSHIQIDMQPIGVTKGQIVRIPVTITIDPQIEHEKIFLSVSFAGDHFSSRSDAIYKSAWTESITFDIAPKDVVGISLGDCIPIDIPYTISGGNVLKVCKSDSFNSVRVIVDADSSGVVSVDIPKTILYALGDTECTVTNDFFVLMNKEEILANIAATENGNLVTVDFTKGIHEIEIVGANIMPYPSPAQYCGIVELYEKKFLAPLDQTDRGVAPEYIRCNEGLVLIKKIDDTPACVKPESIPKLVERTWAKPPPSMFRDDSAQTSQTGFYVRQNDFDCSTAWRTKIVSPVESVSLEEMLRNEIEKFGEIYDLSHRKILIGDIGNNRLEIHVQGCWGWPEYGEPDLESAIDSLEVIDIDDGIGTAGILPVDENMQLVKLLETGNVSEFNELKEKLNLSQSYVSLKGANLKGIDLQDVNLFKVRPSGANFKGANLSGVDLSENNLRNSNFQDANLVNADFSDSYLSNVNLQGANLQNAYMKNTHFYDSSLRNANLQGADLTAVNFGSVVLLGTDFQNANLQGTHFAGVNLVNLNLEGTNLHFANLQYADMRGANLSNSDLVGADLFNANLRDANFSNANLQDANLDNANLLYTNFLSAKNLPISIEEAQDRGAIVD